MIARHHIGQGDRGARSIGHIHASRRIGSVLVNQQSAQTQNAPVIVGGDLHVPELVALLGGGDEMLAAILDPLHRRLQAQRGEGDDGLFGIEHQLRPEAAAHIGGHDADAVFVHPQQVAEDALAGMGCLGGAPHGQAFVHRVVARQHAPAFHGLGDAPVLPVALADDMGGGGEDAGVVAITQLKFRHQIARCVEMRRGGAGLQRGPAIGHGDKLVVMHHHQIRRIFGHIGIAGDHGDDGLAHMDGFGLRQNGAMQLLPIGGAWQGDAQQSVGEMGRDVGHGPDRHDARKGFGGSRIDARDQRMGVLAAHEGHMQGPGKGQVIHIAAGANQQGAIFEARDVGADDGGHLDASFEAAMTSAASKAAATMPS